MSKKSSVKVTIVGEEYTIRSDESAEHTRAVARYVDETIRSLMNSGAVVESHRAAILAALQITDELFRAREAPREMAERLESISATVRRMLPPTKRGGGGGGTRDSGLGNRTAGNRDSGLGNR